MLLRILQSSRRVASCALSEGSASFFSLLQGSAEASSTTHLPSPASLYSRAMATAVHGDGLKPLRPLTSWEATPGVGPSSPVVDAAPAAGGATRGMSSAVYNVGQSTNIKWHESKLAPEQRQALLKQKGCVIWMTGLSGSGKSTLAYTLEHALASLGKVAFVLDGDNVRHGLNKNLGFSAADREENIRRVGEVAKLFSEAGVITIVSFISPYRKDRDAARALLKAGEFIEVYMKIPLSVCEQRDPKGLYKLARAGKIKGFTGIDDPYEEPEKAEIVIEVAKEDGVLLPPEKMAEILIKQLDDRSFLTA